MSMTAILQHLRQYLIHLPYKAHVQKWSLEVKSDTVSTMGCFDQNIQFLPSYLSYKNNLEMELGTPSTASAQCPRLVGAISI